MTINVAIATDTNYFRFMETAALSAILNKSKDSQLCFHILCDRISAELKTEFEMLCQRHLCCVKFYDSNVADYKGLPDWTGSHISMASYLRLELAEKLSFLDKVIYLDCDVLVCADLANFYSRDVAGYDFAGVEDLGYRQGRFDLPEKFPMNGYYINAGVLLINLKRWRENNFREKFLDFGLKNIDKIDIRFGDQDLLNLFSRGRILAVSHINNVQDSFYRFRSRYNPWYDGGHEVEYAAKHPAILHYTYKYKPWNTFCMPMATRWISTYKRLVADIGIENDEILSLYAKWKRMWFKRLLIRIRRIAADVIRPHRFDCHLVTQNKQTYEMIVHLTDK